MSRTPLNRRPRFRALARAVSWHRRKLAVIAAVAAVLTGVNAALPPDPPTVEVVAAAHRLDGGAVVAAADLTLLRLPLNAVPDQALTTADSASGHTVLAPLTRGQVLTRLSIGPPSSTVRAGRVVSPLRLADADVAALLRVGDVVDVVAADGEAPRASVVARSVRVVGLPRPPDVDGVGAAPASTTGALVLVDVDGATATLLAQAAVTATLSVVLR